MKSRKALAVKAGPLSVLMDTGIPITEKHCRRAVTAALVVSAAEGTAQPPSFPARAGTRLSAPRRFHPRGRRSSRRRHTHHNEDRQEVLQPKPGRVEALHLQPDNRRIPGAHRQELGFDLALLPSLLWVPGGTLFIHNVGHASDSE